jgi:hypothetical protein
MKSFTSEVVFRFPKVFLGKTHLLYYCHLPHIDFIMFPTLASALKFKNERKSSIIKRRDRCAVSYYLYKTYFEHQEAHLELATEPRSQDHLVLR